MCIHLYILGSSSRRSPTKKLVATVPPRQLTENLEEPSEWEQQQNRRDKNGDRQAKANCAAAGCANLICDIHLLFRIVGVLQK